jgi:hypothetical protein
MLPLLPFNRPFDHPDLWQQPRSRGGIAPLRHDRALAEYLEKRAAHGAPALCEFGTWAALRRLCTWIAGKGGGASLQSHSGRHATP